MFKNLFLFSLICLFTSGLKSQEKPRVISFNGVEWWEGFKKENQAELYNSPYSLTETAPRYLWNETGVENGSLLFDGYSTYLEIQNVALNKDFAISFWIAPRAFDSAIDSKISSILDFYNPTDSTAFRIGLLQHGQLAVEFDNNMNLERFTNENSYVNKNHWNYVSLIKKGNQVKVEINNKAVIEDSLGIDFSEFFQKKKHLMIGRNSKASGFGDKFKFNMISGLIDEIIVKNEPSLDEIDQNKLTQLQNQDLSGALRLDFSKYENERFKPAYHATAPAHWMNEPHAPLYYNGKYHLFYQHNPFGPYWGQIHWGHWVSDDMVNWEHTEIALAPEKGNMAPDGIWSGSAFVGPENIPLLFYTAGNLSKEQNQYTSIAVPKDTTDVNLQEWKKTEIIVDKPSEYKENEFRDPFVFQVDGTYYMIVGSGIEGKGGTAPIFESQDALSWKYLNPFYIADIEKYPFLGGVWELPVLLPLREKNGTPTDKVVFMVLPLRNEADVEVFYWIGEFDTDQKKFVPDDPEPKLMDYGDFGFTGPSGFIDPKTNRSIVFSIAQGKYGNIDTYDMGWAHNAGLPIELWLSPNNELRFGPIKELEKLREPELISCTNCNAKTINQQLEEIKGEQLEILMEFEASDLEQGIEVRRTDDGSLKGMIYYDPEIESVVFDKKQENPERDFKALQAPLKNASKVKLHIFLDRSMVEIYINDEVSITDRIYFIDKDATGLKLIGPENMNFKNFNVWRLKGIDWKYAE